MRAAMRVMKEQAAEMAQRAASAAAIAARERTDADAALTEARSALASERGRVATLQVPLPSRQEQQPLRERYLSRKCTPWERRVARRTRAGLRAWPRCYAAVDPPMRQAATGKRCLRGFLRSALCNTPELARMALRAYAHKPSWATVSTRDKLVMGWLSDSCGTVGRRRRQRRPRRTWRGATRTWRGCAGSWPPRRRRRARSRRSWRAWARRPLPSSASSPWRCRFALFLSRTRHLFLAFAGRWACLLRQAGQPRLDQRAGIADFINLYLDVMVAWHVTSVGV